METVKVLQCHVAMSQNSSSFFSLPKEKVDHFQVFMIIYKNLLLSNNNVKKKINKNCQCSKVMELRLKILAHFYIDLQCRK